MEINIMEIVFATYNDKKIKEVKLYFKNTNFKILSLKDINYKSNDEKIIENGFTFYDNAKIKAEYIYKKIKMPLFADDSGICINVLGSYPGIYTSRFGINKSSKSKNLLLLKMLKNILWHKRNAYYISGFYFIYNKNKIFYIEKKCEGKISFNIKGNNGFGFDSIFYLECYKKTMAEISQFEKNKISHRGKTLKYFHEYLKKNFK